MKLDINNLLDNVSNEWAKESISQKKAIAVLQEKNRLLEAEINELKNDKVEIPE